MRRAVAAMREGRPQDRLRDFCPTFWERRCGGRAPRRVEKGSGV